MERSGVTPQVAADTSDLVDLVKAGGPLLSLRVTTEASIDNAAQRSGIRIDVAGAGIEGGIGAILRWGT